jgi:hypothetical protein
MPGSEPSDSYNDVYMLNAGADGSRLYSPA